MLESEVGGWPAEGSISKLSVDQNQNTSDEAVNDLHGRVAVDCWQRKFDCEQTNKQINNQASLTTWESGSGLLVAEVRQDLSTAIRIHPQFAGEL